MLTTHHCPGCLTPEWMALMERPYSSNWTELSLHSNPTCRALPPWDQAVPMDKRAEWMISASSFFLLQCPVPLCSLPPILPGSQCPHLSPTIKTLRKVSSLSLLHMSMKESTEGLSMTVRETWLHVALPLRTLDKTLSLWVSEFPSLKRGGFVWISSWDLSGYYSLICERKETGGSNHYCSQWKEMVGWWGRRTQSNKRGKIGGRERGIEWGRKEGREAGGKEGRSLEAFENFLMHQAKYFENFRQHYSLYSTYYMVLVYCLNHKLHANGLIHKPLTFFMSP